MSDPRGDFFASGSGTSVQKAPSRDDFFSDTLDLDSLPSRSETPSHSPGYNPRDIGAGQLFGDMAKGLVGGIAHGAGTVADIVTGTGPGEGSHAERWAAPFAITDSLGQLDPEQAQLHEAVGRGLDATIGTGPLAQTLRERVPQAVEGIATVVPVLKGAGGAVSRVAGRGPIRLEESPSAVAGQAPRMRPDAPLGDAEPTTTFGKDTLSAAAASPDMVAASPEIRAVVERAAREGGLNRDVLTRHLEADSLPIKMRLTKGQATQDPTQISVEQNARGKNPEFARIFNEQNQNLIDNMDEIRRSASPNVVGQDHIQNGQYLIDAYKAADEPIRADINVKYKALEAANGGQFPVDGKSFVEAADAALAKKMKGRYVPAQVAGDLADLREGGPMTFENFENLRTNLAAEARKAERAGDGNAAAAINIVRESLETLPMTGEAAAIKPLADAARRAAKARFDKLRADPAYRAAVDDDAPMGELSPLADDFVNKYVVKGKAANIRTMRENLSGDPTAGETIAAGALNYVKSKSGVNLYTNEGNFSQAGYNRALSELTPKLNFLLGPQTAEQAQALGNVARYTQFQPRGAFVNNGNTFVAAAREHAANILEGVANVKAGGLPVGTHVRKKFQQRADRKLVRDATAPGAGIRRDGEEVPP
jgi:hypothetical protein